ncbi:DUF2254 domain-containing protein [Haloferula chungangensis]|uniref:DUF2254 domain-containing protein n=1 Tax=Haloferula chungangensis TaxID=1048331 RepID=A0ABW2L7P5_9BACT
MKTKIAHLMDKLRSTFWVVPAVLVMSSIIAAVSLITLDHHAKHWVLRTAPWLENISPEGTTTLLGTIANSVLALAGVTFSVALVALTLASSQFGPRLLRNFIRANTTQFTLGLLLATHVYCLLVIRNVRNGGDGFVPHLATFGAFLLSLACIGLFIAFIQHVVFSIQADRVVADVYRELCRSIDDFFGEEGVSDDAEEDRRMQEKESWEDLNSEDSLASQKTGYLQAVDIAGMVSLAAEHDLHCRVLVRPGDFIVNGGHLVAWNAPSALSSEDRTRFHNCFLIGERRTAEQDFEYCVRQLVEVALRALSPGINDPFTAINCIDYLGGALVRVAGKRLPKDEFEDDDGVPRIRTRPETFTSFLDAACDQIRQASFNKPEVSIRMLEMLRGVGQQCRIGKQLEAVLKQGELIASVALANAPTDSDSKEIEDRHSALRNLMKDR